MNDGLHPDATPLAISITDEWLAAHKWAPTGERNDVNTQVPGFRLRPVAWECDGGPPPFVASDDLCIAVAPAMDRIPDGAGGSVPTYWFVWIYQLDPYRFIHVRHMRYTWELVRLWEGLTGRVWAEEVAK